MGPHGYSHGWKHEGAPHAGTAKPLSVGLPGTGMGGYGVTDLKRLHGAQTGDYSPTHAPQEAKDRAAKELTRRGYVLNAKGKWVKKSDAATPAAKAKPAAAPAAPAAAGKKLTGLEGYGTNDLKNLHAAKTGDYSPTHAPQAAKDRAAKELTRRGYKQNAAGKWVKKSAAELDAEAKADYDNSMPHRKALADATAKHQAGRRDDAWTDDELMWELDLEDRAALNAEMCFEFRYDTSPLGTKPNWVTKAGGLPLFIRAVAHALERAGHTESQAIRLAVGIIKRWASGIGKNVSAKTKAKAVAALAQWTASKASTHA